jgi:hypothetical protein
VPVARIVTAAQLDSVQPYLDDPVEHRLEGERAVDRIEDTELHGPASAATGESG